MAKTVYKKKVKNGKEYYFYRLRHENLKKPKDIYAKTVKEMNEKIKNITYELNNDIKRSLMMAYHIIESLDGKISSKYIFIKKPKEIKKKENENI